MGQPSQMLVLYVKTNSSCYLIHPSDFSTLQLDLNAEFKSLFWS